ncbi:ANTAR domain-containing protein [Pseudarthrobacter sp. LMD1-1-1.1]
MIMGYFNVGTVEAFDLLAEHSQNTNTKVSALAAHLVAAADNGHLHQVLRRLADARASRQGKNAPTQPF